jgi:hypothetical protein
MNNSSTAKARRATWLSDSVAELRSEERKVFAVLLLYGALILFAMWGVKVLEPEGRPSQGFVPVSGAV